MTATMTRMSSAAATGSSEARETRSWLKSRSAAWNQWAAQGNAPHRGLEVEQALRYVERYRALARDLASARRRLPGSRTTAALEALYLQAHAGIDRAPRYTGAALLRLFRDEIPAIIASMRARILWIACLFVGSAAAGWWLISTYPELIRLIASAQMIDQVDSGKLWTHDILNVTPSSILSVRILSNNIVVSLLVFCSGIFLGLGVIYFVGLNGLMLGALFAFTRQHGLDGELLKFISAHGPVELSVICISGAAGMALGESLLRPTLPTRRESFEFTAQQVGKVLLACALLLIVCGCIEGYVSPNPRVPLAVRAIIGLGYWGLMLALLSGRLLAWTDPRKRMAQ